MAAPTDCSLIATDLDGTLLRGDDTLSDRSLAALAGRSGPVPGTSW